MGIAFGGIGVMSARPLALWSLYRLFGVVEVRSMFFATVVFVFLLVLAYLTNPSETSFRAFLTEQSFRQHLSQLDDAQDDQNSDPDFYAASRRGLSTPKHRGSDPSTPFHFTNRASVSVRTPKHVFRSFGVLTVAAVVPSGRYRNRPPSGCSAAADLDSSSIITDSWFIGAFGRWWWGAPMDGWWKESIVMARDEEGSRSGILEIKSLDRPEAYAGLSLIHNHVQSHAPPKLRSRDRDRSAQQNGHSPRSSTPPPLPKSASLPLHSKRFPPSTPEQKQHGSLQSQPSLPSTPDQQNCTVPVVVTSSLSRSPSALFDQSPAIAEVLRQVTASQATVFDLRGQLAEFQASSADARGILQQDLDGQRERKRQDDASRAELKSRTKNLEDSKRHAEGTRREAEKRLRVAQGAQARASTRIERLGHEISDLQQRILDDEGRVVNSGIETSALEQEITGEVERRKKEIKVAEDVVAELGLRARELEEHIASETARLQKAQEEAEMRRQDRSFSPLHVITHNVSPWPPLSQVPYGPPEQHPERHTYLERSDVFPTDSDPSDVVESPVSPELRRTSLTSLSSFNRTSPETAGARSKGYSIFDEDIASLSQPPVQNKHLPFAPFADNDMQGPQSLQGSLLSPMSSSLIPSSLIQSLDIGNTLNSTRSFQSDQDDVLDREWLCRNKLHALPSSNSHVVERPTPGSLSPVSPTTSLVADYDPFQVRPQLHERQSFSRMDMQRATLLPRSAISDPQVTVTTHDAVSDADAEVGKPASLSRRWFSKEKKGLNPDAKEFSLSKDKEHSLSFLVPRVRPRPNRAPSFETLKDAFTPTPASAATSFSSSFFTSSRAFAPSPAEREALTRALGGSSNTSLERLPSLSDVGSLPASPNHVHAVAHTHNHGHGHGHTHGGSELVVGRPAWARAMDSVSLSRRKTTFSPFADEEPQSAPQGVQAGRDQEESMYGGVKVAESGR